jgi:hypothetical protein
MCCDTMVCASCSRPVALAACPVCRNARAELHGQPMSLATLALVLVALLTLAAVLAAHG